MSDAPKNAVHGPFPAAYGHAWVVKPKEGEISYRVADEHDRTMFFIPAGQVVFDAIDSLLEENKRLRDHLKAEEWPVDYVLHGEQEESAHNPELDRIWDAVNKLSNAVEMLKWKVESNHQDYNEVFGAIGDDLTRIAKRA